MANTLEIVIKATDKASKEISSVTKGIDGLGKAGGAIFKTVSIAAAAAATAVGAVGAAIVKLAVDAVPLQGIEAAFQGITEGSAEMLDALRASSNGMVRDTELMKSYNLAAQLVGKEFADKLPDAMGYLQKVAAATGQDMSYMMDSLVRGVGRMSPMILDNLGIQVTLEEATAEAAAMFGVEASELNKVQLQAGMTNVVMRALERNTANMPEVAGSAAQQWAAFNTQLANFKDRIGMGALPILQRILGTVEDAGLGGWLDKVSTWFGDTFVSGIMNGWDRLETFFHNLSGGAPWEGALRIALSGLLAPDDIENLIDIGQWIEGFVGAIKKGDWSSASQMIWDQIVVGFGKITAGAGALADTLRYSIGKSLGLSIQQYADASGQWIEKDITWESIGAEVASRLLGGLLGAAGWLVDVTQSFNDWATDPETDGKLRQAGKDAATSLMGGMTEWMADPNGALAAVTELDKALGTAFENVFYGAESAFGAAVEGFFSKALPDTIQSFVDWWHINMFPEGSFTWESLKKGLREIVGRRAVGGYSSGLTIVGERGPELVSLPSGSYVHDSSESRQMMSGPTVNFGPGAIVIQGNATARDVEVGVLRGLRAAGVAV